MTNFQLLLSIPGGGEWFIIGLGLAAFIFWIMTVVEIATSDFSYQSSKLTWLLISILLGVLGAIIYRIAGRKYRIPKN